MLNTKRSTKNNVYNGSKSRSKSIYRGDQSHTLSMHIRIDNEVSPDKIRLAQDLRLQHKYSHKENKIQAFRESLKMSESGTLAKRTQRDQLESRSSKKLTTINIMETQRAYRQLAGGSYRKQLGKVERQLPLRENRERERLPGVGEEEEQIGVDYEELKTLLLAMRKLAEENRSLRKELGVLVASKPSSSVARALLD